MHLHEYQAKHLLSRFGIPVPMGQVVASPAEGAAAARQLGCPRLAIKAQILAGERMAAGGVAFARSPEEASTTAARMLGQRLETVQSRPGGSVVSQILVEEAIDSVQDLYAAVAVDGASGTIVALASAVGGEGIEARARQTPGLMRRCIVDIVGGKPVADFEGLAAEVIASPGLQSALAGILKSLAAALLAFDARLIEINPLAVTANGRLVALDAKITLDANALQRHPELATMRAANEKASTDAAELEAQRHNINFITLDGNVGVAVNGAGLALATLDMMVDAGIRPANFMDIRTTASSLDIAHGFKLLLDDPRVKVLLVNIHGGGMQRCDTVAEGLGIALRKSTRSIPIITRMAGNNAAFAATVLDNNGVRHIATDDMAEAVRLLGETTRKEAA